MLGDVQSSGFQTHPLTERIQSFLKAGSDGGNPWVASNLPAWTTEENPAQSKMSFT